MYANERKREKNLSLSSIRDPSSSGIFIYHFPVWDVFRSKYWNVKDLSLIVKDRKRTLRTTICFVVSNLWPERGADILKSIIRQWG